MALVSNVTPQKRPANSKSGQMSCVPCRKRKSRCRFDSTDPATCLMCKVHETSCFASTQMDTAHIARTARPTRERPRKAKKGGAALPSSSADNSMEHRLLAGLEKAAYQTQPFNETPFRRQASEVDVNDEEGHVIGPVLDAEARTIDNYLSDGIATGMPISLKWWSSLGDPLSGAVAFNKHVRRRPLGIAETKSIAYVNCEVIEKLIEPYIDEVLNAYFSKEHICFPLLDESSFRAQYSANSHKTSPALLACLFAHAVTYWSGSIALQHQHHPDQRYIWNKATEALFSELHLTPGISTVIAILLNIGGRPLTYMIGNGVLLGSATSLAHALGLNRDCSQWTIDAAEKALRTRLWWMLFIHDKWSSVAYGTPPRLRSSQHDVRPPDLASLFAIGPEHRNPANGHVFLAYITLTQILDHYLEEIFNLQQESSFTLENHDNDVDTKLSEWELMQPPDIRNAMLRGTELRAPDMSNLRLSYLYLRLLSRKRVVDRAKRTYDPDQATLRGAQVQVRRAAEDIVLFTQELNADALSDFWFPLNAFAFSTTVASLIRCALELEQSAGINLASSISVGLANDLIEALKHHKQTAGWDLGDICIAQYSDIIVKLTSLPPDSIGSQSDRSIMPNSLMPFSDNNWHLPELWELFSDR